MTAGVYLYFFLFLGVALTEKSVSNETPLSLDNEDPKPVYPYPRIVIMGQSGVGKSSLGNVLAGCEPSDEECFFPVCSGSASCTKTTSIISATFLGDFGTHTYGDVTLVDTPGFGDSTGDDTPLLTDMIDVLKNILSDANLILLCQEGNSRFNPSTTQMILELESMFGRERLWDNVMIEVTKWAFDEKSIADRERQGITEESALKDINDNLKEIAHLDHPLEGVFIDSYATYYPDDEQQQSYFSQYADQLWATANSKPKFQFYTIEDILEQFSQCKDQVKWQNDIIEGNITEIFSMIEENKVENAAARAELASNIDSLEIEVATNITLVSGRVDVMESDIDNMETDIADIATAPLGTIIAWVTRPTLDSDETADLPPGWMRCDGSTITHPSIWAGQLTPDINGEKRFLRGGHDGDMLTLEDDTTRIVDHEHIDGGHDHSATSSASPHSHGYKDRWIGESNDDQYDFGNNWGHDHYDDSRTTASATVHVSTTVKTAYSGIGKVNNLASFHDETRPKNINVIYIIRVW